MASVAKDFQKIITEGRERKRNEALAEQIFSRNRRQSAPSKLKPSAGPSLASRVGVKKSQAQQRIASTNSGNRRSSMPAGNVNGEWTHDLHDSLNSSRSGAGALASRISAPGTAASRKLIKKKSKLASTLSSMDVDDVAQQVNIVPAKGVSASASSSAPQPAGITIRGLAGPFAVMGQNFAPGTTAADVESAMTPVGGEMVSCHVVKTHPFLIVEMVFVSREGGERVIETFNNKTADGRLIKVYPKVGGYQQPSAVNDNSPPANAPSGPRGGGGSQSRNQVVNGSMGFNEDMNTDVITSSNRPLYSDRIVGNRRGRGFPRGRGGR